MKKQVGLAVSVSLLAFCSYAQPGPAYIPGSAEDVGLKRIVPDTLVWFKTATLSPQLNGFVTGADTAPGSSVEATARLLGDSTFLLAASLRATNNSAMMARNLVLIPANGGTPKLDSEYYDDTGTIYLQQSNEVRQDGNPGRVGGDMRYGATNYMTAAECTLFNYFESAYFSSDDRYSNPFFNTITGDGSARTYAVQNLAVNPLTLAVTPRHKVAEALVYPEHTNQVPALGQQTGRTGSSPFCLANGNFVVVGEDRSRLVEPTQNAAIAKIYAPDGTIVKSGFEVQTPGTDGSMWDSVGAWRGGFFVKPNGGISYCYDNDGNFQGTITNNASSGVAFDTGRNDGTRFCSDIRSHYMFGAGKSPEANPGFTNIMLCAWDLKTRLWITNTIVTSPGNQDPTTDGYGTRFMDRCNVACDAYDRVTVAYRLKPDNYLFNNDQIVARVFKFTGTNFIPLTPQFFAFIQHDGTNVLTGPNVGFLSKEPSVAMTPREILIYAEGTWNGIPNATNTPTTSGTESHCYTILSHPDPIPAPRPQMTITPGSQTTTISWQADAGLFVLQSSPAASPTSWTDVSPQPAITRTAYVDPTDQYQMSVPTPTAPKYYRLVRHW
jgi:hypothetical protein